MNNAELYEESNCLQKRGVIEFLESISGKIKWKNQGERVVDIGCGGGSVTAEVLQSYIPSDVERLVGCDINPNMVSHATKNYANARTRFQVADIEGELPDNLRGSFDHAFSFYTFHWIKNQERAFRNMYSMLSDGGECFLVFIGHTPLFDVYRLLSNNNKWSCWIHDVERFVSPYHDSERPEKEITMLMDNIGFKNIDVKCTEKKFIYKDLNVLKKAVSAVNPFNIPEDLFDDYVRECCEVPKQLRRTDAINNNHHSIGIETHYTLIQVYATK